MISIDKRSIRPLANSAAQTLPGCMRNRLLQNNSEQSLFVEPPQVGAQRLGLANYGLVIGMGLREGSETRIGVNIIDDNRSTRPQCDPSPIHLKANVLFTMQAIMNEKVDLAKFRKEPGKAEAAASFDIRPTSRKSASARAPWGA